MLNWPILRGTLMSLGMLCAAFVVAAILIFTVDAFSHDADETIAPSRAVVIEEVEEPAPFPVTIYHCRPVGFWP